MYGARIQRRLSHAGLVALTLVACCDRSARADEQPALIGPASETEIAALIAELGNPAYEKRTFATRRLCVIGMDARSALVRAGSDPNTEIALRARQVLAVLDNLLFAGVSVRLSLSKSAIPWDEAVDVIVTMTNESQHSATVPFELDDARRSATVGDARQVADALDVAEWLLVTTPTGRAVALHIDEIAADPSVGAVVQERLDEGPTSVIAPGATVALRVAALNRGWARYLLLDRGPYTMQLEYVPTWRDEALAAARVGRVVSEKATLTVTEPAPDTVSRRGVETSLSLDREEDELVARLTNRTDQAMWINRNFGGAPPFAQARWVCEERSLVRDLPIAGQPGASWDAFDAALLVRVAAGASVDIARADINDLRAKLTDRGAALDGDSWSAHFSYSNRCDRQWQRRQGSVLLDNADGPALFRTPLPRRLLSGWHTSNAVVVVRGE